MYTVYVSEVADEVASSVAILSARSLLLLHRSFLTLPTSVSQPFPAPSPVLGLSNRRLRSDCKRAVGMFRHPRDVAPGAEASELGRLLEPLPVLMWGASAMGYLGVPIVVGVGSVFALPDPTLCGSSIERLLIA